MKNYSIILPILRVTSVIVLFNLACVIPTEVDETPFTMSFLKSASDTVSPIEAITVCFSKPVESIELISFIFEPTFYQVILLPRQTDNTILITPTEPFQGNTRYVIRPKPQILSNRKDVISPEKDSLVFYTHPFEKEPNNYLKIADLLTGRVFGSISTSNDTDLFHVQDTSIRGFYLISKGSQTTFSIRDSSGRITAERAYTVADTFWTPDSFIPPIFLQVNSYQGSLGGYYEAGYVKKTGN